jgi:hypothetical protein
MKLNLRQLGLVLVLLSLQLASWAVWAWAARALRADQWALSVEPLLAYPQIHLLAVGAALCEWITLLTLLNYWETGRCDAATWWLTALATAVARALVGLACAVGLAVAVRPAPLGVLVSTGAVTLAILTWWALAGVVLTDPLLPADRTRRLPSLRPTLQR